MLNKKDFQDFQVCEIQNACGIVGGYQATIQKSYTYKKFLGFLIQTGTELDPVDDE